MRVGVIDLGTNTFKLLVAERPEGAGNGLRIIHSEEVGVFLGRGGIERNMIADEAAARGIDTLHRLVAKAKELGAAQVRGFGTSALRNARNGTEYTDRIRRELGLEVAIIPGEEEAGLILDGVRQVVAFGSRPMLVMDIGGGSTEFILATDRAMMWKHSFELGTTRLLERFPDIDPMGLQTQLRMAGHIDSQFELLWSVVDRHWPTTLVGSAGSFDTIARLIALERGTPSGPGAFGSTFSTAEFDALKDKVFALGHDQRAAMPGIPGHRVDTIIPALLLVERVLLHGVQQVHWSKYSLKEGVAARLLQDAAHGPATGGTAV
ncbi:MAG: hypothetical protein J5I62_10280 [Flavobacteriales bacterium]|nr:hypothetical protein [Flavobacteriales bacterium]MEB2341801.1 exopolyphosphatase [Flavobacteriia bacterium]